MDEIKVWNPLEKKDCPTGQQAIYRGEEKVEKSHLAFDEKDFYLQKTEKRDYFCCRFVRSPEPGKEGAHIPWLMSGTWT
ncbi:hypothetical protein TIFTF001_006005 [Ficus carica]|uniref:Uncharacterized protein n=1 Tax=Ficus carica TaxID=3494 RepID=A0AA88CZA3_FICCA|nr:hypothetical protein TIFTF001_006005 [Ficus carica]